VPAVAAGAAGLLVWTVVVPAVLLKPYRAPSESMLPTLEPGDRFLVNRLAGADVGDVVVFHAPRTCGVRISETQLCPRPGRSRRSASFVKRVVAGPGDRVALRDGRVIRNGAVLDEPYVRPCSEGFGCTFRGSIRVPEDHWFVLGDNRGASDDSRFWGPVPDDWVVGQAFLRYWPAGSIGGL
jgi:signal peptidase I